VNLHQYAGVNTYYLRKDYIGDLTEMDSDVYLEMETFPDNIVKVLEVYDALGTGLIMNDPSDPAAVLTLAHDTLFFKDIEIPQIMSLVYQAYYPKIKVTETFRSFVCLCCIPGL
jgi:hypothetical protein